MIEDRADEDREVDPDLAGEVREEIAAEITEHIAELSSQVNY